MKMSFLFQRRVAILSLLMATISSLVACSREEVRSPPPRGVIAFEVKAENKGGGLFYSGEVRPRVESQIGFRISGKMIERRVNLGDTVRPGQVLARLDRTDPTLAAQAAGNQMAAAEAEYELARAELKRFESLREQNFVSQAALDSRNTAFKSAENRLAAARAQANAAVNQASYADLLADVEGVVSAVLAEPGQVLTAGAPVLKIARSGTNEKEVVISVPENGMREIRTGMTVSVSLWADDAKHYRGQVREISPQADPVTRTFAAKVALQDADENVRLGMTATVALSGIAQNILQVPSPSIVQQDGKPAVWVLAADGATSLRPVVVAAYREDGVILSGGVKPGEKIVAAGGQKLLPGERVRILETR